MWPFNKRETVGQDFVSEAIKELEAFRPLGGKFNYLGRTCIVTGYLEYELGFGLIPCVKADYVDDHGIIRPVKFSYTELANLKAENQ